MYSTHSMSIPFCCSLFNYYVPKTTGWSVAYAKEAEADDDGDSKRGDKEKGSSDEGRELIPWENG